MSAREKRTSPARVGPKRASSFVPNSRFNPATKSATYSAEFTRKFFAAQGARNNQLIADALARLAKIEKGEGDYKEDEPFIVRGSSQSFNGARLDLADRRLSAETRAPRKFIRGDGSTTTQVVPELLPATANPDDLDRLRSTSHDTTVRHFLSFLSMRTTADYAVTKNGINGIEWRSTANSAPGNVEGVTVPTLVVTGSCGGHMLTNEITYDHSAAKDKEIVVIEGGNHNLAPCKPEFGDTTKRAFDYVDTWLIKAGRF